MEECVDLSAAVIARAAGAGFSGTGFNHNGHDGFFTMGTMAFEATN
jgi:hypothetical protein